ncbi:DNA mismatch repair protein mutL [Candidatus Arthromitus sp. SFB-3]|nr:DNA mismatch repair protein mutL [Candidatus Arthromitus sp. SFB-3]
MSRVNILDSSITNKIAAGEVVEKPAAIVKELVENSIDAKSKNIIVKITSGGKNSIEIIDDGEGIHRDDIEKIFLPHATSKISSEEDLFNINSFGFRGEALPSIASVSRVSLKSRSEEFDYGMSISLEGGTIINKEECSCNIGTEIIVKDIFFNTPARLKFLKSESRETAIIRDVMTKLAISNYEIGFEYISNGKLIFKTNGMSLRDAIIDIFGFNILNNLFL